MHELSLCEGILRVIEEQAESQQFDKVKTVRLELGAFSGVEKSALQFGFDVVTKESIADGARLEIIDIPAQAWCTQCNNNVEIAQRFDACPRCEAFPLQITAGEELLVKELEVE